MAAAGSTHARRSPHPGGAAGDALRGRRGALPGLGRLAADAGHPVALLLGIGVVGIAGGVAFWVLGPRTRWAAIHGAIVLAGVLTAFIAWRSVTAVGIVGLGPVLIAIGLLRALFFSLVAARLHVLLLLSLTTAGAIAATPGGFAVPWAVLVLATAALTENRGGSRAACAPRRPPIR